jgi:hypothetical protein
VKLRRILHSLFHLRLSTSFHTSPLCRLTQSTNHLPIILQFFYLLLLAQALQILTQWPSLIKRDQADYLWPLQWAQNYLSDHFTLAILTLHLVGSLSAAWLPQFRFTRILAFLGIFFFVAWNNSFGKIGHSTHFYVLIAFLWIFIPSTLWHPRPTRKSLLSALEIFQAARLLILTTYTLAGLSKLVGGIYQSILGQPSIFNLDAMSRHIATRLLDTGSESFLGAPLIQHPTLGFLMLWGAIYLQLFALIIYFRPYLAAPWAIGLSLFHLGAYFTMTIHFPHHILLLTLFFIFFPPPSLMPPLSLFKRLQQLPIIGFFISMVSKK